MTEILRVPAEIGAEKSWVTIGGSRNEGNGCSGNSSFLGIRLSHNWPIARHCMPQKHRHQIAITALRSAAPASAGFGHDRVGFVPSAVVAASSVRTSSTKASTSLKHSRTPEKSWRF